MSYTYYIQIDDLEGNDLFVEVMNRFGHCGAVRVYQNKCVKLIVPKEKEEAYRTRHCEYNDVHSMREDYVNGFLEQHGMVAIIAAARETLGCKNAKAI